jgi:hypothetical protein
MHVRSALLRVVALYNAAILLPGQWNESLSSELTKAEIKKQNSMSYYFERLPFHCSSTLKSSIRSRSCRQARTAATAQLSSTARC